MNILEIYVYLNRESRDFKKNSLYRTSKNGNIDTIFHMNKDGSWQLHEIVTRKGVFKLLQKNTLYFASIN